jgi:hypothetical protein
MKELEHSLSEDKKTSGSYLILAPYSSFERIVFFTIQKIKLFTRVLRGLLYDHVSTHSYFTD